MKTIFEYPYIKRNNIAFLKGNIRWETMNYRIVNRDTGCILKAIVIFK